VVYSRRRESLNALLVLVLVLVLLLQPSHAHRQAAKAYQYPARATTPAARPSIARV
jgi:hypothetical protein